MEGEEERRQTDRQTETATETEREEEGEARFTIYTKHITLRTAYLQQAVFFAIQRSWSYDKLGLVGNKQRGNLYH